LGLAHDGSSSRAESRDEDPDEPAFAREYMVIRAFEKYAGIDIFLFP
jgi:hypothetical protein